MLLSQSVPIRVLKPGVLLFLLSLLLYSCQKDRPVALEGSMQNVQTNPGKWLEYNRIGGNLETAFSYAIMDDNFKWLLALMTQQKVDGDYEVLLSDLMSVPMKNGGTSLSYFMNLVKGAVSQQDMISFMAAHPATIVGVRGNPANWLRGTFTPCVKFIPDDFVETTKATTVSQNGSPVQMSLASGFSEAVIVIMRSERHDENGDRFEPVKGKGNRTINSPMVGASDVNGSAELKITCDPEPTTCPATLPTLVSFSATPENGGMKLSYNIQNLPQEFCTWGRIKITRFNPNNTTTEIYRYAHQPYFFYDATGNPGVTYTYQVDVYVAYQSNAAGGWVTCPASNNLLTASATYPQFGAPVETYAGSNQSSTSIRYDWLPPAGGIPNEYRIRRATTTGYATLVTGIPGSQTDYFYNSIPSAYRGDLIETQIQYRASGPWQGNFFDRTYASYREPGEPLYFHGVRLDLTGFEYHENPLFGAPEVRLTALQANAAEETDIRAQTFLPMSGCQETVQEEQVVWNLPNFPFIFFPPFSPPGFPFPIPSIITVTYNANNGLFYPSDAPNGYQILDSWSPALYGSAITVTLKETDVAEPIITEVTETESSEVMVKGEFGFKLFKVINSEIGVESTWEKAKETTIRYPDADLDIEFEKIIYYHDTRIIKKGRALFSNQEFSNQCARLNSHL